MRYLLFVLMTLVASCTAPNIEICTVNLTKKEAPEMKASTRLEQNSRDAVVKVYSRRNGGLGMGTGTVFKYRGEIIVVTAAHVIDSPDNEISIYDGTASVPAEIVYLDMSADIAVIKPQGYLARKPIPFRPARRSQVKFGLDVLYSGFPNDTSMLTIRGYITGLHRAGYLYMHSYAWPGASGSAVLDPHGRIVGVLIAVDVGTGPVGFPNIIEDIVVVTPIWMLDIEFLDAMLGI